MAAKLMGYKGVLLYGTKGSTATNRVMRRVDCEYGVDITVGSTTSAGDGSVVPIATGEAVLRTVSLTFNMVRETNDAAIVALEAANKTGDAIALAFTPENAAAGFGLDADCIINLTAGAPLNGEQTVNIEIVALSDALRTPVLNATVTQPSTTTTTTTT